MTWALRTGESLDDVNLHLAALEAHGLLGIAEEDGRATCYFPDRIDGLALEGTWEEVGERDWSEAWKAGLEAVTVGTLTIAPPWIAVPGAVVIEPAQAFGTGHHETTTGCLAALQELDLRGRSLLDVGTGTGVLAICGARLGAAPVVAVDTDPLAVAAARDNAAVNVVAVDVRAGSADAVAETFDVVVANLDTATLAAVATELVARLRPGGTLIASGVSVERAEEAVAALLAAGLPVTARPGREWVVAVGRRP